MLENVLLDHFAAYPDMQPQDAVKLVYQHTFGPGHMIRDAKKAALMLQQEMASLPPVDRKEPLYESIGNGLCRLNLRPCVEKGIDSPFILRLFLEAAQSTTATKKELRQNLRVLQKLAEEDETPFEAIELDVFMLQYEQKGYPTTHHSDIYRAAYAPAYRVVIQKKLKDALKALRK
ncbi:MAG: hypothetical protein IJB69_07050 [Clostridia bacterium]|nr:hypothetical protein [Clostridia bacterium]